MKRKTVAIVILALLLVLAFGAFAGAYAASADLEEEAASSGMSEKAVKAVIAGAVVGGCAIAGAIGMALTIRKSTDGMARQPEASGRINSAMMLGLVFIETTIIYGLIVAILIIFVL
ncbi:MAG: ATP synthase F0 subunit C [Firmicutes bacterium]|nr:ATP synthase F0 subunit C [Bacillota bacterium]